MRKILFNIHVVIVTLSAASSALSWSPGDCGISDRAATAALQEYCATLRQKAIGAAPGQYVIGRIEKSPMRVRNKDAQSVIAERSLSHAARSDRVVAEGRCRTMGRAK
jgi:hypothetical protein